jgi:hypothetical protein
MKDVNWTKELLFVIGLVIGLLIPYCYLGLRYAFTIRKADYLEGIWYSYHLIETGSSINLVKTIFKIKKGFSVTTEREKDGNLKYKGSLVKERNFVIFKLVGIEHDESVTIRIYDPMPTDTGKAFGLYLSLDYNANKPNAGPVMISKKELGMKEAELDLLEKTSIDLTKKVISI